MSDPTQVIARNGQPTNRTRRVQLTDREKYKLMAHVDAQRDRIDGKMTLDEIVAEVREKCGVSVTKGNVSGALADFGLKARRRMPLPGSGNRAKVSRLKVCEERIEEMGRRLAALEGLLTDLSLQVARMADGPPPLRMLK